MRSLDRAGNWKERTVAREGGIPYEGAPVEPEAGHPVAEALDGLRGRGANGVAELPEDTPRGRRLGREVAADLLRCLPGALRCETRYGDLPPRDGAAPSDERRARAR